MYCMMIFYSHILYTVLDSDGDDSDGDDSDDSDSDGDDSDGDDSDGSDSNSSTCTSLFPRNQKEELISYSNNSRSVLRINSQISKFSYNL